MKKFFITISLVLGLISTANATNYKDVVISSQAGSIINSLRLNNNFDVKKIDGINYCVLRFDDISSEFNYLSNSYVDTFSEDDLNFNISGGTYMQINSSSYDFNDDYGICRSFTKAVAPDYPTKITMKENYGTRLSPNLKVKFGSIIASHARDSSSTHKKSTGHVAVVLYVGKKYIWVMDQNAYINTKDSIREHSINKLNPKRGIVGIHKIKFKQNLNYWKKDYYDNSNAYNYHVLHVKE